MSSGGGLGDGVSHPATRCRFPAEWEPCESIWLAWPHNRQTWPGRFDRIPDAFVRFAREIAVTTPVNVVAGPAEMACCRQHLGDLDRVEMVPIATNDCWIRDYGPVFVIEAGRLVAVDFKFNAWGGKYEPYDLDASAARQMCEHAGWTRRAATLTLEGGALETDGCGRLIANPRCLVDERRNPGMTTEVISRAMHQLLGITEIVWVDGGGLAGDDTDGHIDQVARFVDPENVVVAVASDPNDPSAPGLRSNFRQLQLWSSQTTPAVNVHSLPTPAPRQIGGQPVPQSYCNFLRVGPERLLVPTFDSPATDAAAMGILADLCPKVDVVGVPCEDLAWGLGALHCCSCHQPRAT